MEPRHNYRIVFILLLAVAVGFYIFSYGRLVIAEIGLYDFSIPRSADLLNHSKMKPIVAKGIYLTAVSAAHAGRRQAAIDLIGRTELNAVVIDIKDYTGNVLYDSALPLVNELKTERNVLRDVRAVVKNFRDAGIYVIARQTVFQDPALADARSEWAIRRDDGSLWRDYKGLSWVDPTRREVWEYNLDIAREAALLGFDEINFDYVRFPSDGDISTARYARLSGSKPENMRNFFLYVNENLKRLPVYYSLDLFGLVLEAGDFDLNIGQRLVDAVDVVDYVYPMTYPSHYPAGHLGYANPADYPYAVVHNGLTKAGPVMQGKKALLRPWLQAFNLGAVYDGTKIRSQISAVEESDVTAGWMLWNASNNYSADGLGPDEEQQS